MEFSKDLNAASATQLILAVLNENSSYGYAIIRQVEDLSGGQLQWEEGMVYPVLHRLEKQGWIESYWESSGSGRRRKFYRILSAGQDAIEQLREQWEKMDAILQAAWTGVDIPPTSQGESIVYDETDLDQLPVSLL